MKYDAKYYFSLHVKALDVFFLKTCILHSYDGLIET